jgi:hypothetical protein
MNFPERRFVTVTLSQPLLEDLINGDARFARDQMQIVRFWVDHEHVDISFHVMLYHPRFPICAEGSLPIFAGVNIKTGIEGSILEVKI